MSEIQNRIYSLMRDFEELLGANQTTKLVYMALINALRDLKDVNNEAMKQQILWLIKVIRNSEPRIIALNKTLLKVEQEIANIKGNLHVEQCKYNIVQMIHRVTAHINSVQNMLARRGAGYIQDNDVILIHSISSTLYNMLLLAKKDGRKFSVVVAKQDRKKTKLIIRLLEKHSIDFEVLPEFAVSHVMHRINKVFTGAISVTKDKYIVANIGSMNIVLEAKNNNVPVYVFVVTLKFSHKSYSQQHIHTKDVMTKTDIVNYRMTKYSHDSIPLKLVDKIITEEGEYTSRSVSEVFEKVHDKQIMQMKL
jgi:ribose 1,5-bisphosphate isomerase